MSFPVKDEIAWAGGLFEGEGYIAKNKNHLRLASTDEDTVRRFHRAVGGLGKVFLIPVRPGTNMTKPQWSWEVSSHERTQAVLAMIWPGLGQRRRARAKSLLLQRRWGGNGAHARWHIGGKGACKCFQ